MRNIEIAITAKVSPELATDSVKKAIGKAGFVFTTEKDGKVKIDFGKVPFSMDEPGDMTPEKVAALCEAQERVNLRASYVDEQLAAFGIETSGGKTLALAMAAVKAGNPKLTDEECKAIVKQVMGK